MLFFLRLIVSKHLTDRNGYNFEEKTKQNNTEEKQAERETPSAWKTNNVNIIQSSSCGSEDNMCGAIKRVTAYKSNGMNESNKSNDNAWQFFGKIYAIIL